MPGKRRKTTNRPFCITTNHRITTRTFGEHRAPGAGPSAARLFERPRGDGVRRSSPGRSLRSQPGVTGALAAFGVAHESPLRRRSFAGLVRVTIPDAPRFAQRASGVRGRASGVGVQFGRTPGGPPSRCRRGRRHSRRWRRDPRASRSGAETFSDSSRSRESLGSAASSPVRRHFRARPTWPGKPTCRGSVATRQIGQRERRTTPIRRTSKKYVSKRQFDRCRRDASFDADGMRHSIATGCVVRRSPGTSVFRAPPGNTSVPGYSPHGLWTGWLPGAQHESRQTPVTCGLLGTLTHLTAPTDYRRYRLPTTAPTDYRLPTTDYRLPPLPTTDYRGERSDPRRR